MPRESEDIMGEGGKGPRLTVRGGFKYMSFQIKRFSNTWIIQQFIPLWALNDIRSYGSLVQGRPVMYSTFLSRSGTIIQALFAILTRALQSCATLNHRSKSASNMEYSYLNNPL